MKKSTKVTLTVVAMIGLASCNRRRDPCDRSYFNDMACQEAVRSGGYYYGGTWVPMRYSYPYPYYYDSYRTYVGSGGRVYSSSPGVYSHPSSSSSGVTRGGFGSTGSGSSSGS